VSFLLTQNSNLTDQLYRGVLEWSCSLCGVQSCYKPDKAYAMVSVTKTADQIAMRSMVVGDEG
jgi:hypothetical protein